MSITSVTYYYRAAQIWGETSSTSLLASTFTTAGLANTAISNELSVNYEQRTVNGTVSTYHYVSSPDGLVAIYVKQGSGAMTPYYVETDHLGSICKIYDASGNQKFSAAYDPWGKQTVNTNTLGLTRGYCAHEHWNQFGLIDMNGRFYDPVVGRFLSSDPYVQDPGNPQNFNRYSYCLNNPLKYTDPSGEKWWLWAAIAEIATGGLISTTAIATAGATIAVANVTANTIGLSPNNLSSGYDVQNFFSPIAVKLNGGFGSMQNGKGFDISIGVPKCTGFGYRFNLGKTKYSSNYCDFSGKEKRKGGEWDLCGIFSYSGTTFESGEISQTTNKFTLGGLSYENDKASKYKIPGIAQSEGGSDEYRTAAVRYQFGPFSMGLNMCTGNATKRGLNKETNTYEFYTDKETGEIFDPDKYRAGVLYIGIGSFRIGRNSEDIRNFFQNELIHSNMNNPRYFKKLDIDPEWYWYFGSGSGNTLW